MSVISVHNNVSRSTTNYTWNVAGTRSRSFIIVIIWKLPYINNYYCNINEKIHVIKYISVYIFFEPIRSAGCDYKWLWVRFPLEKMKYLL